MKKSSTAADPKAVARIGLAISALARRPRLFGRNEDGAAAVAAAILFPVVVAGMGLGAEAGYWYLTQRELQHAADLSAHAGAVRMRSGDSLAGIEAAALNIAEQSGFDGSTGVIDVNTPPASGPSAGDGSSVEVILTENQPRLFSSIFSDEPVLLSGRAVAKVTGGSVACVLALSPTAPGAVTVAGSTTVTLNGCDVASNSGAADALQMQGDARLTTDCAHTVGEAVTTTALVLQKCVSVHVRSPVTADPYAGVEEPAVSGMCRSGSVDNVALQPSEPHPSGSNVMRFCGGLSVRNTVRFGPGLYIIDGGDFTVNAGAVLAGTDVTFYLINGARLRLNGGAQVNFAAPTAGVYSGLLFFGARDNIGVENMVNGASGSTFDGAIYFPGSNVQYSGRAGSTGGCTQIVAQTVTFTGNSEVQSDCQAQGTRPIATGRTVQVIE